MEVNMKNRSDRRKNGHYTGKKEALHVDLRVPFLICFAVGLILLGAGTAISHLNHPGLSAFWFGIGAIGVFVLTCAIVFGIYMFRHTRLREAVLAADHVNTEVYDMFRYVIDVPYAVVGKDGVVKIINSALQDVLGYTTPVCNIRLSEFCAVPVEIIAVAAHGAKSSKRESDLLPDGPITRLADGKRYELQSYPMRIDGEEYFFTVFRDVNGLLEIKEQLERENPVVAYIAMDNLQELTQFVRASYRETANRIEQILQDWVQSLHGLIREYDRDKYVAVFSEQMLDVCIADRFSILNTVMDVKIGDNTFPVSVSMGVASIRGTMEEKEKAAYAALEVALSRGGNQVALRRDVGGNLEYFGGTHKILESNSSINSRVSAGVLATKLRECGNVLIMGHATPDFGDALRTARVIDAIERSYYSQGFEEV